MTTVIDYASQEQKHGRQPGGTRALGELLSSVLNEHGGLDNWSKVARLTVKLELGGPFWAARGWPEVDRGQTVTLDARHEHIAFAPFPAPDWSSVFDVDPERVVIWTTDGEVVEEGIEPRGSFPANYDVETTRWDPIQVAYFLSAAVWNYLTEPFGFTYSGVQTHEIEPWQEAGQTWRRLAVTFPPTNANHNPDQVFYYDENFMLRRMDYSPDVTGSPPIAHYTYDEKIFDGFVFPTRRLVHRHAPDGIADQSFAPITINIHSVAIERG
jgi:hypothetical protein